jgi:thioredoxin reductase
VLLRARRTVAVVDAGGPRNAPAAHMHGFLSRDGMAPRDLLAAGRSEVASYGGHLIDDTVVGVEPGFHVRLASGSPLRARRILVATGLRDELPEVPGVRECWGRDLLHCPYCHGWEVRDQSLGVLGGTPEAVQHALLVRQWSPDVTLFPHTDVLSPEQREQLTARGIQVVEGTVARLVIDIDHLQGVELGDGTVIARAAVFVRPRFVPNAGLLVSLVPRWDSRGTRSGPSSSSDEPSAGVGHPIEGSRAASRRTGCHRPSSPWGTTAGRDRSGVRSPARRRGSTRSPARTRSR